MNKCVLLSYDTFIEVTNKDNLSIHREVYIVQASAPTHQLAENEPMTIHDFTCSRSACPADEVSLCKHE